MPGTAQEPGGEALVAHPRAKLTVAGRRLLVERVLEQGWPPGRVCGWRRPPSGCGAGVLKGWPAWPTAAAGPTPCRRRLCVGAGSSGRARSCCAPTGAWFQIADGQYAYRVAAVIGVQGDGVTWPVGDEGVVAPVGPQGGLRADQLGAAHHQPLTPRMVSATWAIPPDLVEPISKVSADRHLVIAVRSPEVAFQGTLLP